jgi:hypothetical protein
MARIGPPRPIKHAYYNPLSALNQPRPTPLFRAGYPQNELIGGLNDSVYPMVLDNNSVILLPSEYEGDNEDEYWRDQVSAERLFQTGIAYEKIGEDDPRIAR